MGEGVGENHLAALLDKINGGIVAGFVFRNIVLHDNLIVSQAKRGDRRLNAFDVCIGIAFVLVAEENKADFEGTVVNSFLDLCRFDRIFQGCFYFLCNGLFAAVVAGIVACIIGTGGQRKNHDERKQQSKSFLHAIVPP